VDQSGDIESERPAEDPRLAAPIVREHSPGVFVVRDDLYPGGTKARFAPQVFENEDEVVYASPCEGGAQTALATVGAALGKRVTIFCAKRKNPHPRSLMAKRLGATIVQVSPGYLTVVHARAAAYCIDTGAKLLPFGLEGERAIDAIADAARKIDLKALGVEQVWCAAGSGVLSRALARAWRGVDRVAVQIGRPLSPKGVANARIVVAPWKFEQACPDRPPFPSDPHYDAKAWAMMMRERRGRVLFWNVTGPAG
jgi:hypothetical protein